jgi:hypothetical protein
MRRFDVGPLIVALGALVLLVSLFLDWYGDQSAWDAFELADLLLAVLAIAALVVAAALVTDTGLPVDRRWLPGLVLAAAVIVIAEILSPPAAVGGADPQTGAWLAFGAVLAMLVGMVLSLARVSFSFAIEGRQPRQRVAAVDHRPPTTEAGAPVPRPGNRTAATQALPGEGAEQGGKRR